MANPKFMLHFTSCDTLEHAVWNHPDKVGLMGRCHKNGGTVFSFEDSSSPPGQYLKFFDLSASYGKGEEQYVRTNGQGFLIGDSKRELASVFTKVSPSGDSFFLKDHNDSYVRVQCDRLMCNNGSSSAARFTFGRVVDMGTIDLRNGPVPISLKATYDSSIKKWTFMDKAGSLGDMFYCICHFASSTPSVRPWVLVELELTCDSQDEFYFSINHRVNVVKDSGGNWVPETISNGETKRAILNIERISSASTRQGTDSLADHFTVHVVPTKGDGSWGDPTLILKRKITPS